MSSADIRLSALQREVVEFGDGSLLVVAGPGSGKTRVLTERVRRLLTSVQGHFRVLALTFTNKAANEMKERLKDLGDLRQRAFIGTLHGFCLEMLADRGKLVGVANFPQIFEEWQDRKQILLEAVMADPLLAHELEQSGDLKARNRRLDDWLRAISQIKTHPITHAELEDGLEEKIYEAYNANLHASGAYDFDDLLILAYRLLSEQPKIADFYRRLYRYICIDEAQDLNEVQYAVLQALCGDEYKNVMMVGDPKQSIYGFNTSGPEFMDYFAKDFSARKVELTENFRSSSTVVNIARALEPAYVVNQQLPIAGQAIFLAGRDEADEAKCVVDQIERLLSEGHPDVEGPITPAKCAILGRTRYTLLAVEKELKERKIPFFKRLSATHENESELLDQFQLALRVVANPKDRLHLSALAKSWNSDPSLTSRTPHDERQVIEFIRTMAHSTNDAGCRVMADAVCAVAEDSKKVDVMAAVAKLRSYADSLGEDPRRAIYDDTEVLAQEWDQYLRSGSPSSRSLGGFLANMALGTTQQIHRDGVALLTVHSSKGLEFEVVFIVGMADGVFPDYRAQGRPKEMAEEARNAFVAVTRSRRLLFFSLPMSRTMPWGDTWASRYSPYLHKIQAYLSKAPTATSAL